ncbi:MAG: damage-control phosphatase ARMT1 family protein [Anaerolineae bacterium]
MKTYLDCYPCFLRQALDAARFAGASDEQQARVLQDTLEILQTVTPDMTPPTVGDKIHRHVRELVNHNDPYAEVKQRATERAQHLLPQVREMIRKADDPFEQAVRMAIAGNIIDFGPGSSYDLSGALAEVTQRPLIADGLEALRHALDRHRSMLYIGDNAGETVFDRALIEVLDVDVTYVTKGAPVLNDATLDDAKAAGLHEVAHLITTGSDAPGTILARASTEFRRAYDQARVIIAKGQANYETLSPGDERLFFLLKAKCPVIARDLGVETGSLVVKQGQARG